MYIRDSQQHEHDEFAENSAASSGTITELVNNVKKSDKIYEQYPDSRLFCDAITEHAFKTIICSRIEEIHDSYIFHGKFLSP